MDKKTIAYLLIGAGVLGAIYYFWKRSKDAATAGLLGAGMPDDRGNWAADDDATYTKMRNRVAAHTDKYNGTEALYWIDPLVEQSYASGQASHFVKAGKPSKAGSFLAVMEAINPHPNGQFTGNQSGGKSQLFPDTLLTAIWNDFYQFKVKYSGL